MEKWQAVGPVENYADGNLNKYMVECPLHGWVYDIRDGKCLSLGDRYTITYKLRIQDGILEINMD